MHLARRPCIVTAAALSLALDACGSGGGIDPTFVEPGAVVVQGKTLELQLPQTLGLQSGPGYLTIDGEDRAYELQGDGQFECDGIPDGEHSLFLHRNGQLDVEVPFRIQEQLRINLGEVVIDGDCVMSHSGFDGCRFGCVDEDGAGINDQFVDADGDGVCDLGATYAGYAYSMNQGHEDLSGDGVYDRFRDANGDHLDDMTGEPCAPAFGWTDEDGDGVNDRFVDADGDGVNDNDGREYAAGFAHGYSGMMGG